MTTDTFKLTLKNDECNLLHTENFWWTTSNQSPLKVHFGLAKHFFIFKLGLFFEVLYVGLAAPQNNSKFPQLSEKVGIIEVD